jgi:mono/diheme cytochrome c family protein
MLRRKIFITICCITALLVMSGCTKSNQPVAAGSGFCDTSSVTYTKNVLPILQSYCYGCHGNANVAFSDGISLDGYDNVKGWADVGYLVGDVRHDAGFTGMPYGKPKLSACEINTIVAWVNQGEQK